MHGTGHGWPRLTEFTGIMLTYFYAFLLDYFHGSITVKTGNLAVVCVSLPDHRKETQTAEVWTRLQFIRSDQNHVARHNERGDEEKADGRRGGKTISGNEQTWSSPSPRGQWRTEKNGGNWL